MRVVLHVAIEKHEDLAAAVVDPRLDRGGLPEVAAKADHAHTSVARRELTQALGAAVAAAVIDVHDLERTAERFDHPHELAMQRFDAVHLVEHQDDHGQLRSVGSRLAGHARIMP